MEIVELESQLATKRESLVSENYTEVDPWDQYHETFQKAYSYANSQLGIFLLPVTFVSSAYLFRLFLGFGKGRKAEHRKDAHILYLYVTTGELFWFNFVTSVLYTSYAGIAVILFQYFPLIIMIGGFGILIITALVFFVWANRVAKRTAIKLRDQFGLEPARRWWHFYEKSVAVNSELTHFCVLGLH